MSGQYRDRDGLRGQPGGQLRETEEEDRELQHSHGEEGREEGRLRELHLLPRDFPGLRQELQ